MAVLEYSSQVNQGTALVSSRVAFNQLHLRTKVALESSSTCSNRLQLAGGLTGYPLSGVTSVPMTISDGSGAFLVNSKAGLGPVINGVPTAGDRFGNLSVSAALSFPLDNTLKAIPETFFSPGVGRPSASARYHGVVELRGAPSLASTTPIREPFLAVIPVSVEIDTAGKILSCTSTPEQIEESLGGGSTHSVRDCAAINGQTIPTKDGLLCRVQNLNPATDSDVSCPAGWSPYLNYTSTELTSFPGSFCHKCGGLAGLGGGKYQAQTLPTCTSGQHAFANIPLLSESVGCTQVLGSSGSGLSYFKGISLGSTAYLLGFSNPITFLAGLAGALLGLFSCGSCNDKSFQVVPQVIGRACI